jgi:hypothetical protein
VFLLIKVRLLLLLLLLLLLRMSSVGLRPAVRTGGLASVKKVKNR